MRRLFILYFISIGLEYDAKIVSTYARYEVLREVATLSRLQHQHVVRYYQVKVLSAHQNFVLINDISPRVHLVFIEFMLLSAIVFAYVLFVNNINFHENRLGSKQELLILLLAQIGDQKLQVVQCSVTRVRCQLKFMIRTISLSQRIYIFKWSIVPGKEFVSPI